jgi:hypothetical protein
MKFKFIGGPADGAYTDLAHPPVEPVEFRMNGTVSYYIWEDEDRLLYFGMESA